MINKVLIAEDHESSNISVQRTMEDLGIGRVDYFYYCDDALAAVEQAVRAAQPYDLLITDLSFEPDHRAQQLRNGTALIEAARKRQPELKVMVFSGESRVAVIESLINEFHIDAYVRKSRIDTKELKMAVENMSKNLSYFPRQVLQLLGQKNTYQFTGFDIVVIELLSQGKRQKEIPGCLQERNIQPSGLSTIEKRLSHIREQLDFSNNEQLVAFCKDKGII